MDFTIVLVILTTMVMAAIEGEFFNLDFKQVPFNRK
jgi:hypothetical protein